MTTTHIPYILISTIGAGIIIEGLHLHSKNHGTPHRGIKCAITVVFGAITFTLGVLANYSIA